MTKCIVGLGNPGRDYAATRHNVGFDVLALLSQQLRCPMHEGSGDYLIGTHQADDCTTLLLAPMTYMNNSGIAVKEVCDSYEIFPGNILVVLDDFQLPLGTLRLRGRGSDGGHNGLSSIIYHMMTDEIPRLRFGIAGTALPVQDLSNSMADYVLSVFEREELELVQKMLHHAADACLAWRDNGIDRAMSSCNKSFNPAPPSPPASGECGGANVSPTSKGE